MSDLAPYLRSLGQRPQMSPERELELILKAQAGDHEAMTELVLFHAYLVIDLAKKLRRIRCPLEDLIQAGNIGLIEAIKRFDPKRGTKLCTCAGHWIFCEMEKCRRNAGFVIHRPSTWFNPAYRQKMESNLNRGQLGALRGDIGRIDDVPDLEPADYREGHATDCEHEQHLQRLRVMILALPVQRREVIRGLLRGQSAVQIGKRMGLGWRRIMQIRNAAIEDLQEMACRELLRPDQHSRAPQD